MSQTRRLAAIMFTDMVGYTALGQRNEALSLALVDEHRKVVRPILARHGGREVKTMGDAFMVEFGSALDAVRCAYDIQRGVREFNISLPEDRRVHLRIGVHLGDVVESQGDISGDAVNVASRIEPLAQDGGVCVTRMVYESVSNKLGLPFVSVGARELKNVSGATEVYRMVMPWEKEGGAEAPGLNPRRVAVLPFVSLSPDPNDEYFADGLTEELITRLSFVNGLEVIARTSAMNYKKERKNAALIGRELKVGTLLEGSVRKAGNRIRVTAQLINANTEGHLWAENYDRTLDDVFEVQSSVAENVAGALKLKLVDDAAALGEPKVGSEAYVLYLRGLHRLGEGSPANLREARSLFEAAVKKEPSFARAYACLARTYWFLASSEQDLAAAVASADAAAKKALQLAPDLAEAHAAMADVYTAFDRFDECMAELETAIRLNPNLAVAHHILGVNLATHGSLEEGIAASRKALSLDPLSAGMANSLGTMLRMAGRTDEALQVYAALKALSPNSIVAYAGAGTVYLQLGDIAKAEEAYAAVEALEPGDAQTVVITGVIAGVKGDTKGAEDALAKLSAAPPNIRSTGMVLINQVLGRMDEAYAALMEQAERHSWYAFVKVDPLTEPLRRDPRFAEFCRKVGLPA